MWHYLHNYDPSNSPPNPNDPDYIEYKFCQAADAFLFALEMFTLSADLLSRRALKRATRKLTQSIPPGSQYNDLRNAVHNIDDLAKKKFPNYQTNPPSDEVFDTWLKTDVLGYNRNIEFGVGQQDVIMHTCVDCFHILDFVTFIKP